MLLNRYLSIKIYVDCATFRESLIALYLCMVHSVATSSGLNSVDLKKKKIFVFRFFFLNCFQEEDQYCHFISKLSTYFARAPISGKFIGVWGLMHQCGPAGTQRTGTFLFILGLRKMCSKLLTLAHSSSFGNAPSVIRLSLNCDEKKKFVLKFLI